jgi:hypothetical protein
LATAKNEKQKEAIALEIAEGMVKKGLIGVEQKELLIS